MYIYSIQSKKILYISRYSIQYIVGCTGCEFFSYVYEGKGKV